MKKRIAKVLCAAVLGGSLAVTAFPGVTMAAEKDGGFKVAYITRNQSDPFAAELVNSSLHRLKNMPTHLLWILSIPRLTVKKKTQSLKTVSPKNMTVLSCSQTMEIFSSHTVRKF